MTDQIRRYTVTDEWVIDLDGKSYTVTRKQAASKVYWRVEGGGNFRSHYCDPDGKTFKRVVAWVQAAIAPKPIDDEARRIALEPANHPLYGPNH